MPRSVPIAGAPDFLTLDQLFADDTGVRNGCLKATPPQIIVHDLGARQAFEDRFGQPATDAPRVEITEIDDRITVARSILSAAELKNEPAHSALD